jgi:translation initiation factor 1
VGFIIEIAVLLSKPVSRHIDDIAMDLHDQLKKLFPAHELSDDDTDTQQAAASYAQSEPLICKYEKRNGKPVTIVEGFEGNDDDLKDLTKKLKVKLGVGGSFRDGEMLIQGDYRDKIMALLKADGFRVKRVGG